MGAISQIGSRVWPVRSTLQFMRWFKNWPEVLRAYRRNEQLPPLKLRNGQTIYHDASDEALLIFREIFVAQCYTGDDFYRPAPGDVVIDIGANIGIGALYLNWLAPGIRIHCYEPATATRQKLNRNIEANKLHGATVYSEAISDRQGSAVLFSGSTSGHGSLIRSVAAEPVGSEDASLITLEQVLQRTGDSSISLLKIDAEGSEVDILSSNSSSKLSSVQRVAVEYHETLRPGALHAVQSTLVNAGFDRLTVVPGSADGKLGLLRAAR